MVEINTVDLIEVSVDSKLTHDISEILSGKLSNEDKGKLNLWLKSIHYNKVAISRKDYEYITKNNFLVYPCGTMISTKLGGITGMVVGISVRFDKVQYEIQYIKDGEGKDIWMNEAQFNTTDKVEKIKLGYII
jgi:hypothetical protein